MKLVRYGRNGAVRPGGAVVREIEAIGRLENQVVAADGQSLVESSGTAAP